MPPKRKMAPQKKDGRTTPSIIDAFNAVKKQPRMNLMNVFMPNEIIDLCESQEDLPGPSTVTIVPETPESRTPPEPRRNVEPATKWNPGVAKPAKRISESAKRAIGTVLSTSDRRELGCDLEELKAIEVDANLECVQEDVKVVRELMTTNCALVLPKRSIFIISMFIRNWLRIFPANRICICSPDPAWFEALKEQCALMEIDESSFSHNEEHITNSRLMLTNNSNRFQQYLCDDPLSSEFRCVIVHQVGMTPLDQLRKTINQMFKQKATCRFIMVWGGGSIGNSTQAIRCRQAMVTVFHLSKWIEPKEEQFATVVKPSLNPRGMKIHTWTEADNPFHTEAIDQLEKVIKELTVDDFLDGLEEVSARDLIFAPLQIISNDGNSETEDFKRLVSLLYHLFSFGKEAFEKKLAVVENDSDELPVLLISSRSFNIFNRILRDLDEDHKKIKLIKELINKAKARKGHSLLRGVILVESPILVESMLQCLSLRCKAMEVDVYPMGRADFPLSRAWPLLQNGGVLILSIHNKEGRDTFQSLVDSCQANFVISTSRRSAFYLDNVPSTMEWHLILHETREKIRAMIEEEEKEFKHERMECADVHEYPYYFESNGLPLDVSSAVIRLSTDKTRVHLCTGVSLTPAERALLSSRSITWRDSRPSLTLTHMDLLWNEDVHSSHPSTLSRRLVNIINPRSRQPLLLPLSTTPPPEADESDLPCACTRSDGEVFYSSLISKLSNLFS